MKNKYEKIVLFCYLALTMLMLVFVGLSIIDTSVSIKYKVEEYLIASEIQSIEISDNEKHLLKTIENNYKDSISTLKIISFYFIVSIIVVLYKIAVLYKCKCKKMN